MLILVHTELVILIISSSSCMHVELVKLDFVHKKKPLFTHEGVKSSYYNDPLSHQEGFYADYSQVWVSSPIFSSTKCKNKNLIFPLAAC